MITRILFAAFQADHNANGGMESAARIFEALTGDFRWTLLADREIAHTERWRAGDARLVPVAFDGQANGIMRRVQLGLAPLKVVPLTLGRRPDEDLASRPEETLRAIIALLGLSFDQAMLAPDPAAYSGTGATVCATDHLRGSRSTKAGATSSPVPARSPATSPACHTISAMATGCAARRRPASPAAS